MICDWGESNMSVTPPSLILKDSGVHILVVLVVSLMCVSFKRYLFRLCFSFLFANTYQC